MSTSENKKVILFDNITTISKEIAGGKITLLSKMLGLHRTGLNTIFGNNRDLPKKCDEYLLSYGYSPSWVRYGTEPKYVNKVDTAFKVPINTFNIISIPVIGRVPAGFPDLKEEDILEFISIPDAPKGAIALIVEGNSMSGDDIRDGDYVLFVKTDNLKVGEIVVATNEFGESFIKKYVMKDDEPWLNSSNPEFPNFKVNGEFKIIGKFIERIRRKKFK